MTSPLDTITRITTIANGATRPSGTSHPSNSSDAANNNPKPPDSHNRSPTSGGHITRTHNRVPLTEYSRFPLLAVASALSTNVCGGRVHHLEGCG